MRTRTQHVASSPPGKGRTGEDRASDLTAREKALDEREARMQVRAALLEREKRLALREEAVSMRERAMSGAKAQGAPEALARQIADEAMALQAQAKKSGGAQLSIADAVDQIMRKRGLDRNKMGAAFKESHAVKRRERQKAKIAGDKPAADQPMSQPPEALARDIVAAAEKLQAEEAATGKPISWAAAVSIVSRRMQPLQHFPAARTPFRPLQE